MLVGTDICVWMVFVWEETVHYLTYQCCDNSKDLKFYIQLKGHVF